VSACGFPSIAYRFTVIVLSLSVISPSTGITLTCRGFFASASGTIVCGRFKASSRYAALALCAMMSSPSDAAALSPPE
jgi:hypothetical protein